MNRWLTSLLLLGPLLAFGCAGFTKIGEGGDDSGGESGDNSGGTGNTSQSGGNSGTATSGSGGSDGGTGNAAGGRGGATGGGSSKAGSTSSGGNGGDGATSGVAGVANGGSGGSAGSSTTCDDASDCVRRSDDVACLQCPNGEPACPTFSCMEGQCVTSFPTCAGECQDESDCPAILAPCQACEDGSVACPWSRCEDGMCKSGFDKCPSSDPCDGKSCGDTCTICTGTACPAMPSVLMFCDETLTCQLSVPACTAPVCETNEECNVVDDCPQCPGITGCASRKCVEGACVIDCSDPPTDPCGGCPAEQICIQQNGGPGPAQGFICAEQLRCGAAGACACIVDQGTCTYEFGVNGEQGICVCDNGLE